MKLNVPAFFLLAFAFVGCGAAQEGDVAAEAEAEDASATQRALDELAAAYDRLSELVGQGSDEAVDIAAEDIENIGDWEYRIVELENGAPEELEAQLNELGNERWEAYWIESSPDGVRVFLKRTSISYLSRLPLSALVRLLAGVGQ